MAQPQPNPPSKSSCSSVSICRFLLVSLVLVVLPLFPSEAPEPINQTILANLWELLHLLFIGIAVSYGLFGRKSSEIDYTHPIESTRSEENSQPFLSGISQVSRFFEDGFENHLSGSVEKSAIQPWNSHSPTHFMVVAKLENQNQNPRSLIFPNGSSSEKMVSQTWNSQYFPGESVVVVTDENGETNGSEVHKEKPLGLPVRSLRRSRNVDHDCCVKGRTNTSIGSFKNLDRRRRNGGRVRGLTPTNLEDKFKESSVASLPSPVPWRSRSSRLEKKGDDETASVKPTAAVHKRPLSVGAFDQLDYLQSQSFWSPIFLETTNPLHNLPNTEKEDIGEEKSSYGSLLEVNLQANGEEKPKTHSRGKSRMVRSLSDAKNHVKGGSPRGKSVRTVRSKEYVDEDEKLGRIRLDQKNVKESKKRNHDKLQAEKRSKLLEDQNEEKEEIYSSTNVVESRVDLEMKLKEDFDMSSEEPEAEIVSDNSEEVDDEHDEEVDRKAGEFIAKFREQIRLQKIESSRGFGGRF